MNVIEENLTLNREFFTENQIIDGKGEIVTVLCVYFVIAIETSIGDDATENGLWDDDSEDGIEDDATENDVEDAGIKVNDNGVFMPYMDLKSFTKLFASVITDESKKTSILTHFFRDLKRFVASPILKLEVMGTIALVIDKICVVSIKDVINFIEKKALFPYKKKNSNQQLMMNGLEALQKASLLIDELDVFVPNSHSDLSNILVIDNRVLEKPNFLA
jgi:hypothetical protein